MTDLIQINENNIYITFEITEQKDVRLLNFSPFKYNSNSINTKKDKKWFRVVELQVTGENQDDHHGEKHTGTSPADRLKYKDFKDYNNEMGRKLEIIMTEKNLSVTVHYQFYNNVPVIRAWIEVTNKGNKAQGIEYISSFALTGIARKGLQDWDEKSNVYLPHNSWKGEFQWRKYGVKELGGF